MSEKALKFNNIILNKKTFHMLNEPIALLSVNVDQIVASDIITKALSILLVTKIDLVNHYALFYLK